MKKLSLLLVVALSTLSAACQQVPRDEARQRVIVAHQRCAQYGMEQAPEECILLHSMCTGSWEWLECYKLPPVLNTVLEPFE